MTDPGNPMPGVTWPFTEVSHMLTCLKRRPSGTIEERNSSLGRGFSLLPSCASSMLLPRAR